MKKPVLFSLCLFVTILLFMVVRAKSEIKAMGIEAAYCEQILIKVEQVAGCKAKENIKVVVEDRIESGFAALQPYGFPVLGLYEQDKRLVSVERQVLCPWLLAHEMAHAVYIDNYPFHPESWADITADTAVGKEPKWLRGK